MCARQHQSQPQKIHWISGEDGEEMRSFNESHYNHIGGCLYRSRSIGCRQNVSVVPSSIYYAVIFNFSLNNDLLFYFEMFTYEESRVK